VSNGFLLATLALNQVTSGLGLAVAESEQTTRTLEQRASSQTPIPSTATPNANLVSHSTSLIFILRLP
jgi:hypothetical protein